MIIDLLINIIVLIEEAFLFILPTWSPYPAEFLTAVEELAKSITKFNFFLPIDTLFTAIVYLINFCIIYYSAKLVMKLANYIRGTGSGLDF